MWSVSIKAGPSLTEIHPLARGPPYCPGPVEQDDDQEDGFMDELLSGLSSGVTCISTTMQFSCTEPYGIATRRL